MYSLNDKFINNMSILNTKTKNKYKNNNYLNKFSLQNNHLLNKKLNYTKFSINDTYINTQPTSQPSTQINTDGYDTLEYIISVLNKSSRQCKIVTGGIGDFIALDYLYNFTSNYDLIFITTHSLSLKKIMNSYFKNNYFAFYFNFQLYNKYGFETKKELLENIPEISFIKNIDFININDYFPFLIKTNLLKIPEKMEYLNYTIFDVDKSKIIEKFNLPENIAFISPYSKNLKIDCINCNCIHEIKPNCNLTRNFTNLDYFNTIEILKKNNLIGIIISVDKITLPNNTSSYFINLSEKVDIIESIEILKKCKYFIGIDSCFSVFATKILKNENIIIKSNNKHLFEFEKIYYYPNSNKQIKKFI